MNINYFFKTLSLKFIDTESMYFNLPRLEFLFFVLVYEILVIAACKLLLCIPIRIYEFDNILYYIIINGVIHDIFSC